MERASRIFHQTEQCKLLIANSQKAQQDLKFNFNADDYAYIEDCFEIMMQLEWSSAEFIYQRTYKDCVELLKNLKNKVMETLKLNYIEKNGILYPDIQRNYRELSVNDRYHQ